MRDQLYAHADLNQHLPLQLVGHDRDTNQQHLELVAAAIRRDEAHAATLLRAHVEEILDMLVGSLERYQALQAQQFQTRA